MFRWRVFQPRLERDYGGRNMQRGIRGLAELISYQQLLRAVKRPTLFDC